MITAKVIFDLSSQQQNVGVVIYPYVDLGAQSDCDIMCLTFYLKTTASTRSEAYRTRIWSMLCLKFPNDHYRVLE